MLRTALIPLRPAKDVAHAITVGPGGIVRDNHVHHNGQKGVGATGAGVLVEGNEIDNNNYAHVASGWEAGGTKFALTTGLVVRSNCVHDNRGPGLWTDIDNVDTLYENNTVYNNFVEVDPAFGHGITIIWQNRADEAGNPYRATGSQVHDNEVTYLSTGGETRRGSRLRPGHDRHLPHQLVQRQRLSRPRPRQPPLRLGQRLPHLHRVPVLRPGRHRQHRRHRHPPNLVLRHALRPWRSSSRPPKSVSWTDRRCRPRRGDGRSRRRRA